MSDASSLAIEYMRGIVGEARKKGLAKAAGFVDEAKPEAPTGEEPDVDMEELNRLLEADEAAKK